MSDTILACQSLGKTYQSGGETLHILSNVSLEVGTAERIAVIGRSGSGKTTLLNLLAGLDLASAGRVCICNQDLQEVNAEVRRELRNRHLGFVYQFHHLLSEFNAMENISMPLLLRNTESVTTIRKRSLELLAKVGLQDRAYHRPAQLSGGERQRVAIARALVATPLLVFMDEPTGSLDSQTSERIHELMLDLSRQTGTAFVVVTHDHSLAAQMDRSYELVGGQLLALPTHSPAPATGRQTGPGKEQ